MNTGIITTSKLIPIPNQKPPLSNIIKSSNQLLQIIQLK